MKAVPDAVRAALAGGALRCAECHTITLRDDTVMRYTSDQKPVQVPSASGSSMVFAIGPLISGLKWTSKIGLDADEQTVSLAYGPADTIDGQPWPIALREGLFDGATWQWDRAFLAPGSQIPIASYLMPRNTYQVGEVKPGRQEATITLRPPTTLLDINLPRNLWQPACVHALYSSACGASRGAQTTAGSAEAGSTRQVIQWSGAAAGHAQGVVAFSTGANMGLRRTIRAATPGTPGQLVLAKPLDFPVSAGDAFTISSGCNHTKARCDALGGHFRGFPYVPPPSTVEAS